MSDYRLGLNIEHGEDRSYVVHEATGQRYEIRSFDLRRKEYPLENRHYYEYLTPPRDWDLYLGLAEVQEGSTTPTKPQTAHVDSVSYFQEPGTVYPFGRQP